MWKRNVGHVGVFGLFARFIMVGIAGFLLVVSCTTQKCPSGLKKTCTYYTLAQKHIVFSEDPNKQPSEQELEKVVTEAVVNAIKNHIDFYARISDDDICSTPKKSVSFHMSDDIGYIKLENFQCDVYKEAQKALVALMRNNPHGIIIDLQGNRGGSVVKSAEVAGLFTKNGKVYASAKNPDGSIKRYIIPRYVKRRTKQKTPVVILVDKKTASAAELFTVALHHFEKPYVLVIGEKTFGKGIFQRVFTRSNTRYTMTGGEILSAEGPYNTIGVIPDIQINTTDAKGIHDSIMHHFLKPNQ